MASNLRLTRKTLDTASKPFNLSSLRTPLSPIFSHVSLYRICSLLGWRAGTSVQVRGAGFLGLRGSGRTKEFSRRNSSSSNSSRRRNSSRKLNHGFPLPPPPPPPPLLLLLLPMSWGSMASSLGEVLESARSALASVVPSPRIAGHLVVGSQADSWVNSAWKGGDSG